MGRIKGINSPGRKRGAGQTKRDQKMRLRGWPERSEGSREGKLFPSQRKMWSKEERIVICCLEVEKTRTQK